MAAIYLAGHGLTTADKTIDFPKPERLLKGNPERHTYSLYEHPDMECGIWECEVGAWNIVFADNKQEFFNIISGRVRIHDQQGHYIEVIAGQAGIIPPGFQGIFEVVEQVKKYYVIVES